MSMKILLATSVLIVSACQQLPTPAWSSAEDPLAGLTQDTVSEPHSYDQLYRRAGLSLGTAALGNFDTSVQISSTALGAGAVLDAEDSLGIEESTSIARADAFYAFDRKHEVHFSYYDIKRNGSQAIADPIVVGDVTIPAGGVASKFDTAIAKLAYHYNFVADSRTKIGASFGLHAMTFDLGFASTTAAAEESFKAIAPLPVIGLHGAYALDDKWTLGASVELLQVSVNDEFKGSIVDQLLTLEHDTFDNFGWGLGLNAFRLDMEVIDGGLSGEIEYAYQGLMLYMRMYL